LRVVRIVVGDEEAAVRRRHIPVSFIHASRKAPTASCS
jgi:hypothetical protein